MRKLLKQVVGFLNSNGTRITCLHHCACSPGDQVQPQQSDYWKLP